MIKDISSKPAEVTCTAKEQSSDDEDVNEGNQSKVEKIENGKGTKEIDEKSSSESGEYPGAGQPFGEGRQSNKVGFCDEEEYEDVGGFSILKAQAPLYKQIWLKYGHIPSAEVLPISSYPILVMAVKDLMTSTVDMYQCRYVDLSSETINSWEDKIKMVEKLEFNVKTELLEHWQPLRAAVEKLQILRDVKGRASAD
ncbi:uncharacterized protein LOC113313405 [Papaver somniferum]|uniref:uncharacterized protein LOC113313405 n=1 Tax=Papaver somniferum TaxID=3469 RepID=UPI000E6FB00C|nr:uncharacterized protein LOC113313405 [Papaver somniferum]